LDPSAEMLLQAQKLAEKENLSITWLKAAAENVPLPDHSFDVIAAGQCWHWFDSDAVLKEVRRLLKTNGKLVICHFDWLPITGNVAWATEQLVLKYNPAWEGYGSTGIYPQWTTDSAKANFGDIETFSFDVKVPYSHESWRGRMRAMSGTGAVLSKEKLEEFDGELARMLSSSFSQDPLDILHRVWAMVATKYD